MQMQNIFVFSCNVNHELEFSFDSLAAGNIACHLWVVMSIVSETTRRRANIVKREFAPRIPKPYL